VIVRVRWRHDGQFSSVLFVGSNPLAEVMPNRSKPGFSLKTNLGKGLKTAKFSNREAAMAAAETLIDGHYRDRLTAAARAALESAGL
jgi:hypothetical protein